MHRPHRISYIACACAVLAVLTCVLDARTSVCVACALISTLCAVWAMLTSHKECLSANIVSTPDLGMTKAEADAEPAKESRIDVNEAPSDVFVPTSGSNAQSEPQAAPGQDSKTEAEPGQRTQLGAQPEQVPEPNSAPAATAEDSRPPDELSEHTRAEQEQFDYDAFSRMVLFADDPLQVLRTLTTEANRDGQDDSAIAAPHRFLATLLEEAGLFDDDNDTELQPFQIVRPRHSGLFYLRTQTRSLTYANRLRILRIEAALNALCLAHRYFDDLNNASVDDLYRLWQRTCNSICAQAPNVDTADWSYLAMPWQMPYGPSDQGEWAVRNAMSTAIEEVQLPYRLEARFRCNVREGDLAVEFEVTPERVFPRSARVSGLGIVPTTKEMRSREAARYAARVGLLLASHAFHASVRLRRVWVSAVSNTPSTHECLYSVRIDRRAFSHLNLSVLPDPCATLRTLGASMQEVNGALLPCNPLFYLEDKRFCPPIRHDLWELSERALPASAARSLGATRVSGLAIHESLPRIVAAEDMVRAMTHVVDAHRTQSGVHAIMEVAHATSDMSVWSAAERVASKLVDGSMELDDADLLREEMVDGDPLTRAVNHAQTLLMRQEPHEALQVLQAALAPLDERGSYEDTSAIAYRCFDSFSERVLYNRLHAQDARSVVLVPDAYLLGHLTASAILASLPPHEGGDAQAALWHAHRALQVAPLNAPAHLGAAACLELMDDAQASVKSLKDYLEVAFHPQGMGLAYLRLASLMWEQGSQRFAQACFQQSVRVCPPLLPFAIAQFQELVADKGHPTTTLELDLMDEQEVEQALRAAHIPVAPTPRTAFVLYDGATASVDAEVFPVAHDLMRVIETLTGDDVMRGIRRSLEHEPDA